MVLDRATLIAKIDNWIKTNGNKEITAIQMNEILKDLIDSVLNIADDGLLGGLQGQFLGKVTNADRDFAWFNILQGSGGGGGGDFNSQIFTTGGVFMVPAGVNQLIVTAKGAGGGAATITNNKSYGGGGGGSCVSTISVKEGDAIEVIIGIGGSGSIVGSGSNGGDTIIKKNGVEVFRATGGYGGGSNGGYGGSGSIPLASVSGQRGEIMEFEVNSRTFARGGATNQSNLNYGGYGGHADFSGNSTTNDYSGGGGAAYTTGVSASADNGADGNAQILWFTNSNANTAYAGEVLTKGALGYLYNQGGFLKVKLAIADSEEHCADVVIMDNAPLGTESVSVSYIGNNKFAQSSPAIVAADKGEVCYLSDVHPGKVMRNPPTAIGKWRQQCGKIIGLNEIFFKEGEAEEIVN